MRDQIRNALRRVHTDALHNTTIDVFEPSVSYSQGEGWDVSYPDAPSATYDARVESPEADPEKERTGTTSEIDVVVRVRDDTGQQWTGWGEEAQASTRVRDTADGTLYEITSVSDQHNGTLELDAVEV